MNLRLRPALILPLFFCSGAAGLGYQLVWARMFAAGLGHEVPAMIAVVGAFLGGMAVGAWSLGRRIDNCPKPARWYGALELGIGAWGLVTAFLIPWMNPLALALTGPTPTPAWQWVVTFVLPFLVLLPGSAALGATLPAMDRFLVPFSTSGRTIGALYAANTFGAVAGVLGSVFVLMPALGFRLSLVTLAGVNLLCGLIALWLGRDAGNKSRPTAPASRREAVSREAALPFARLGVSLLVTGFLGIGYEIVGVRVLLQVLENTIYTYAAALAIYLVGTAAGAAAYQRFARGKDFQSTFIFLLGGLATTGLLGITLARFSPTIYDASRTALGDSLGAVLGSELLVAALVFGLPTLFMGATFCHLVQAAQGRAGGVGQAGAWNTLGGALAAGLVGVGALPMLGTKWTMALVALGYLLLLPRLRGRAWMAVGLPLMLVLILPPNLQLVNLPPNAKVREFREGVMASVAVIETADGHRSLRVNNRLQMGGTAAATAERRQAHLPLLLHPTPRRVLFLGPGTGITLGAAGRHPGLQVDGVELVPEVRELMPAFEPESGGPFPKAGVQVMVADARRFVRTTTNRYDVIVADLFHPGHDGAGFLYTREHFEAVRGRLKPGGLFCQWLPLHQLDEAGLRSIVRTFMECFSHTHAFLLHFNVDIPALALIGTPDSLRLPSDWFDSRVQRPEIRAALREVGLERALNVLGCFAGGPQSLRQFAGSAPIGTDDHPFILFQAPRFTARREAEPHRLLLTALERCRAEPAQFLKETMGNAEDTLATQLPEYIEARDIYLRGLVEESAGRLSEAINAYLESSKRSLFFTPAYARCVTIIQVMARADLEQARQIFQRLEAAQPAQPLGRQLLGRLFESEATNPPTPPPER